MYLGFCITPLFWQFFFIRVIIFYNEAFVPWHFYIVPYFLFFLKVISYQQVLVSRHVDIITFYNDVFVPAAKPFLVSLISSGTRPEDKKNVNGICCTSFSVWTAISFPVTQWLHLYCLGQISGSPKPSPFPNLPDMSPKKVSSSHNVYVSPLRQTKVFSSSSHSSLYFLYLLFI